MRFSAEDDPDVFVQRWKPEGTLNGPACLLVLPHLSVLARVDK